MMPDDNRTIEQKRAAFALARVNEIRERERLQEVSPKDVGYYVSYVSALPATIITNGLGQALATQLAHDKGKHGPHEWLYDHVAKWLAVQVEDLNGESRDVLCKLMHKDQEVYLQAQGEAMAYLQWLKQFARAYLKESEKPE